MHWKLLLTLFIIVGIAGLLLFSEKGKDFKERYIGKYIKVVGGYLTGLSSKIKPTTSVNRTLDITIEVSLSSLKGQQFDVTEKPFGAGLKYDTVSVGEHNIKLKDKENIDFETESMTGTIAFDEDGKMTISGEAGSLELNGMVFLPSSEGGKIEFNLVGIPSSFTLSEFEHDKMTLTGVTGLLKLSSWAPLALQGDSLDISYFKGNIEQTGDSVNIIGSVGRISLNGVDLSLKT